MKPVIIIAIAVVLLSITVSPVMADEYDDAAAKCPTYECQQAIMNQKMNAAVAAGYDPMQEGVDHYNTSNRMVENGFIAFDKGEYEQAIIIFNQVLDRSTNEQFVGESNLGLAWSYHKMGDFEIAVPYYLKSLEWSGVPEPGVRLDLAIAYLELKEYEKALEQMKGLEEHENVKDNIEFAQKELDKINQPIKCGKGTIDKNGQCVPDPNYKSSQGGGCLIATATYGSELAPQVQQLRELRDNSLLQTESGTNFMNSFNEIYYSFSPIIADYERENPVFREMVKIAITPMISSLSILNYVDMDSEESVLGYGISLILLNIGMYFVAPVIVIMRIRHKKRVYNE